MHSLHKHFTVTALALGAAIALGACSKSELPAASAPAGKASLADAVSQKSKEQAAINALPRGDANTPVSQYKTWNNGNDVMFAYYGFSNMPVDYEKIAQNYSQDFRNTNDDFKKQDILKALRPRIDQEISSAKKDRYIKMTWDQFRLDKYDFQAKGFPQSELSNSTDFGWNSIGTAYRVDINNGDDFKLFKVSDEAVARMIEEKRAKYQPMNLVLYVYLQDVDPNNLRVKAKVMKISLQDKNGTELFAQ
jgi:hypothetical protein